MFTCHNPLCKKECKKIIASEGSLYCENCFEYKNIRNSNLHQIVASDGLTKVTWGKAWEIDNRIVSKEDGRTVINRSTGRPTQR